MGLGLVEVFYPIASSTLTLLLDRLHATYVVTQAWVPTLIIVQLAISDVYV